MLHFKTEIRDVGTIHDGLIKAVSKLGVLEGDISGARQLAATNDIRIHEEINALNQVI